jgi:hypothetical protein
MADLNSTQMRDALAWTTNEERTEEEIQTNPWGWFWQAIQGDFNENRSTGQIVIDAAISMIPLVDQICDVRDLIANCKKLHEDVSDKWGWLALVLTLIGLFPFLGSLVKGVLKVFFAFIRRAGSKAIERVVDNAMTWVVTLLRRQAFQRYLHFHRIDEVFSWLAQEVRAVKQKVNVDGLLKTFDSAIQTVDQLVKKVEHIPGIGLKAKSAFEKILWVRSRAKNGFEEVAATIDMVFDTIVLRLERETLQRRHGIANVNNVHFRGALPEAVSITLMRSSHPRPSWLSEGNNLRWMPVEPDHVENLVAAGVRDGWPALEKHNVESFHKLARSEIKGPARLFRIVSPNSRAMSDCWVSEKVFNKLQNSPDPRAAWRKYLGVWPDWNVNGQFVVYDVKPGECLKVWRGPAASQAKDILPDAYLEGGWEQIVFNVAKTDPRNDVMRYYKLNKKNKDVLSKPISQSEYDKLSKAQRSEYASIRERITHPNISGPFETGWGYTDFAGEGFVEKIGLPSLPGQTTAMVR